MLNTALSTASAPTSIPGMKWFAAAALAIWFVVVLLLGADGAFVTPAGTPPLPILAGAVLPVIAFLAAVRLSRAFRGLVLAADLRLLTAVQAWRFTGFTFLALYAYHILPGPFAWPAGLGDMAMGLTAPWIMLALARRPAFAASTGFRVWNLLGILDLIVAIGTGGLMAALASGAAGEITTRPMAHLPLVLIPAYVVPLFVMLHTTALMQARRLAVESAGRA
jgi:hypothetical protein